MRFLGNLITFLLVAAIFALFFGAVELIRHPLILLAIAVLLILRGPAGDRLSGKDQGVEAPDSDEIL